MHDASHPRIPTDPAHPADPPGGGCFSTPRDAHQPLASPASSFADHWLLDPAVDFLNHGSFGACPRVVLERQRDLRDRLEAQPVRFLTRTMQPLLDAARDRLASLLAADPADLVFVLNATAGANAVLRSIRFVPGDRILVTSHGYNAAINVARHVADRDGASVDVASIPFPIASPDQALDAIVAAVTPRTRLALVDHVTSPTGIVLPIQRIVAELASRDIDTLVDGAHAPGMVPVDVAAIGAAYYTGNCHKWLCAPKGAGFLHVRRDRQRDLMPPVISHGYNHPRPGRSRLADLFDWPGTADPTPAICVAHAIDFVQSLYPGGLAELQRRNRGLALAGRDLLCAALGVLPPAPDSMIGSLAAVPLPDDPAPAPRFDPVESTTPIHSLNATLHDRHRIEVPCYYFPVFPRRLIRISAQAYNSLAQYQRLAAALPPLLAAERVESQ